MSIVEINKRYSDLAEEACCLSCGGALDLSEPQKGEICVDLGSGRGTDVIRMAEIVGEEGFAYGIDISDGMLQKAKKNASKLGIKNVEFVKSELEDIKLEDSIADLLISNCTINHASDKHAVWSEVYRILKNKGRFVISDIFSTETIPEKYKNDPVAVSECWAGAVTKEEYFKTLNDVGFKEITIIEESAPYKKGEVYVSSFTISAYKQKQCCS